MLKMNKSLTVELLGVTLLAAFVFRVDAANCYNCVWTDALPAGQLPAIQGIIDQYLGQNAIIVDASCENGQTPNSSLVGSCAGETVGEGDTCTRATTEITAKLPDIFGGEINTFTIHYRGCALDIENFYEEGCSKVRIQDLVESIKDAEQNADLVRKLDILQIDRETVIEICNCDRDLCNIHGEKVNGENDNDSGNRLTGSVAIIAVLFIQNFL